ncbi:MAG: type IV toxin-antitoxin system AbiEi family antitoxin [Deltaproteobacteria bacterium]|nr:type IV toxin-antitoxin system AbiEi family antitoxin [Deltaproteobacteria bacterium]
MDLADWVDDLAASGLHHFTTNEAAQALGASPIAVRAAIRRLRARGRLATPFRGFHLRLSPEYRVLGCLPADQFVPDLMEHLGLAWYAGVLTAARLHGAGHQAAQVFQVVVADNRPRIRCGRVAVDFVARRNVAEIPVIRTNTPRGFLRVSTPEATAFDLVGYPGHAGGLSNVATVLTELAEILDARKLAEEIPRSPLPWTQRLGFLLESVGAPRLAAPLAAHVERHAREYAPLRPGRPAEGASRDARWRLLLNEAVEPDL